MFDLDDCRPLLANSMRGRGGTVQYCIGTGRVLYTYVRETSYKYSTVSYEVLYLYVQCAKKQTRRETELLEEGLR